MACQFTGNVECLGDPGWSYAISRQMKLGDIGSCSREKFLASASTRPSLYVMAQELHCRSL